MPAEPAFIVPAVPGYRLQRRLGAWLLAGAALLLLASGGWSLWRVASAVDPQLQRLARTIERLRLNELGAEPGVFQATLAGEELQNLVGLGELVPFCLTVRNIHGLAVDQRCLGTAGAHPGGVESLLRATAGEEVGALLPLVRYPGTRVGELALAVEHLQPRAVLLYSSKALQVPALSKLLGGIRCPTVIAGPTVCIHHAELGVLTQDIPELSVAEDLLSAHQLLIQRGIV